MERKRCRLYNPGEKPGKNENLSRNILHPKKSVANCFKVYISDSVRNTLKEDKLTGESGSKRRYRHGDSDDLCYDWAEDTIVQPKLK